MFLAINCVISAFYVNVGPNLKIYFTFIITMIVAAYYPLGVVCIYAIAEDIISFFLFPPDGAFFFGYTLTALVSMIIYWLFLHKKVNIFTIALSKLSVNLIANVLLNSVWTYIILNKQKAYLAYAYTSLIKNIIMLPIEIAIFFLIYKVLKPLLEKYLINTIEKLD